MTFGSPKSDFYLFSKFEWLIILVALLLSFSIFKISQYNAEQSSRLLHQIELIHKAKQKMFQAKLILGEQLSSVPSQTAKSSFEELGGYLTLLQQGGSHKGLYLPQISSNELSQKLAMALSTLQLISKEQSRTAQPPQMSKKINQLSLQIKELENYFHLEQTQQRQKQSQRFLSLIAALLLMTGFAILLYRKKQSPQASHKKNHQQNRLDASLSNEKLQQVIEAAELGCYDWHYDSGSYEVNRKWLEILGLSSSQTRLTIEDVLGRIHPDDYSKVQREFNHCVENQKSFHIEYRMRHSNQQWVWVESSGKAMNHSGTTQPEAVFVCGTLQDISLRKKAEQEHRENDQRFRELIESLPAVAVQGYDKERNVIYWNDSSAKIYGYSKREAQGRKLEDLIIPPPMRDGVIHLHKQWVDKGVEIPASELQLKHKDGHLVPVFSSHVMLKEGTDSPEMFCVDVDLTPQHKAAAELKRLATLDQLTNLPNRRYLEDELALRIQEATQLNQHFAVLFIDIDLFKEINDTMGHGAGDLLLQQISGRIQKHLKERDTLALFGGDEFVILLSNIQSRDDVETFSKKLMAEFLSTFQLFEQNIYITASIGISLFPEDGLDGDALLKYSDLAMYKAKEAGRSRYRFFEQEMDKQLKLQRTIATYLRDSLLADEFTLLYQPQVSLETHEIVSCEALLRWIPSDPDKGTSPDIFIPVAERSDLIIRLGYWVLKAACRQAAHWKAQGIDTLRVDINVSGKQLEQSDFFTILLNTLSEHSLSPQDIGLELTEHALIDANQDLPTQLKGLQALGMVISIDDFGTGYSSLSYLKTFPVDHLKIDRAFIVEAPHNPKDQSILEAIVEVGHKLELSIVVEGIETEVQANYCSDLDCDLAQGYWFHKPMSATEIYTRLEKQQSVKKRV